MSFYPADAVVPVELRTDHVLLRMLRADDVDLDYDAVVSSRAILWLRSDGGWPREGFTREENLADLERHEAEHRERAAFTYTVMNPTETECLGCVYIIPFTRLLERAGADEQLKAAVREDEAAVSFWVRQSRLADNLDRRLLSAVLPWFERDWAFSRVVYTANRRETRQQDLYAAAGPRLLYSFTTTLVFAPTDKG